MKDRDGLAFATSDINIGLDMSRNTLERFYMTKVILALLALGLVLGILGFVENPGASGGAFGGCLIISGTLLWIDLRKKA